MPSISATASAKTILFGEHAVVYQRPAIAVPVSNLRTKVSILANPIGKPEETLIDAPDIKFRKRFNELDDDHPIRMAINLVTNHFLLDHFPACEILIKSVIPIASGLGSSASTAVALIRALGNFLGQRLDDQIVSDLAFKVEKIHHGNPSGIDNTVIAFEKPIFFVKQRPVEILKIQNKMNFVIGDTGIHSLTKDVVSFVRDQWINNPKKYDKIFDQIGEIAELAKNAMRLGNNDEIGTLMTKNHLLLKKIGVSSPELDKLIDAAQKAGAMGAKLCGSGRGGNMVALIKEEDSFQVQDALKTAGAIHTFFTQIRPVN